MTAAERNLEGTIATLRKNLAEAEGWFGPDSNQAGAIRRILQRQLDKQKETK